MCERAFGWKVVFHKDVCELPVLAFSLSHTETGPNEDICIRLQTVAVPERRLRTATSASPPENPSLLLVLQEGGTFQAQPPAVYASFRWMDSILAADFVHYFGPGGGFF